MWMYPSPPPIVLLMRTCFSPQMVPPFLKVYKESPLPLYTAMSGTSISPGPQSQCRSTLKCSEIFINTQKGLEFRACSDFGWLKDILLKDGSVFEHHSNRYAEIGLNHLKSDFLNVLISNGIQIQEFGFRAPTVSLK